METIVSSKEGLLSSTRSEAEKTALELESYKMETETIVRRMEEDKQLAVEAAKSNLDGEARKAMKKMARERVVLKEKNERLENDVKMLRENLNSSTTKATTSADIGHRIREEDLIAECKGWKGRCVEAIEHLERGKESLKKCKSENKKCEEKIRELTKQQEHSHLARERDSGSQAEVMIDLHNQIDLYKASADKSKGKMRELKIAQNNLTGKVKDVEHKLHNALSAKERAENFLEDTKQTLSQAEYGWNAEKQRLSEARQTIVNEKSSVMGRNEHLEREVTRLISELNEETKKKEYAERESSRMNPLQARLSKVSEENELLRSDAEGMRSRLRKLEGESRAGAALVVERNAIREERDKLSGEVGTLKAEVHQLRKSNDASHSEHSTLATELKTEKNLALDLRLALDKLTMVNGEMQGRVDEQSRDIKDANHDVQRCRKENDKLREDQEALGALCSSLKKTLDQLEKEKDSDNAVNHARTRYLEDELKKKSSAVQELEAEKRRMEGKIAHCEDAEREMADQISLHRCRASGLTGELSVAQEALARAMADSKQMNERRLGAEEKLAFECRASERLMRENEKHTEKLANLHSELAGLRGARDGDNAAHAASLGAAQAAAERERLNKEGAEYRESELGRRLGEVQASLTQEIGAKKGAEAGRDATVVENHNLKSQLDEAEKGVRSMKEELYNLYKAVGDLKEDNHKARGSSLALTMEIDTVRDRLGETKERLEGEIAELKERCMNAEKERGQYLFENNELRQIVGAKTKEVDELMTNEHDLEDAVQKLQKEGSEQMQMFKERFNEHVNLGIEAGKQEREVGNQQGREETAIEMRGVMNKMKGEMVELVKEMAEKDKGWAEMMEELRGHDLGLSDELKVLHDQLNARGEEVMQLKVQVGEKESEVMDARFRLKNSEEDLNSVKSKYEFEHRTKDELAEQHNDEMLSLRKRTMSLEKDLARVDGHKKEYKRELARARKDGRGSVKAAVNLVRERVVEDGGDTSLFMDDIFGDGGDMSEGFQSGAESVGSMSFGLGLGGEASGEESGESVSPVNFEGKKKTVSFEAKDGMFGGPPDDEE